MFQIRHLAALLFATSIVFAVENLVEEPTEDAVLELPRPIPDDVLVPQLSGDLQAALAALKELGADDPAPDGGWAYQEARNLESLKRLEEALQGFEQVERAYPDGPYAEKARYGRARLLGLLGRHDEAAAILGTAARQLGGEERRDELASTCISLATRIETGKTHSDKEQNEARARAQAVLTEVLTLRPSLPIELQVHEQLARLSNELGQFGSAAVHLGNWIETAAEAPKGTLPLERIQTQHLALAMALSKDKQFDVALPAFVRLELELSGSDSPLAGPTELGRARTLMARGSTRDRTDALDQLEAYLVRRPGGAERVVVATQIAELHDLLGRESSDAWRRVISTKAALEEERAEAEVLIRAATWSLGASLREELRFDEAMETFRAYVQRYPDGPKWSVSQATIIEIELEIAGEHADTEEYGAARAAWRAYLAAHPLDSQALDVARWIADSYRDEADSLEDADQAAPLFAASIAELERLIQKNPGSDAASSALVAIGDIEESRLGDLTAAIAAWRRCDFGGSSYQAAARLRRVLNPHLAVETTRTRRTNEPPSVQLTTRNLATVEVEVYALDLESYFRRHKGYAGIHDLDLDLIQADEVFTHTIVAPTEHASVTEDLVLPSALVAGPGTWVVSILSDTHRATTLLLVSDLDVILDTAGDDAIVFAENMLTGTPAAGVQLLLEQAGQVFTAETDSMGLAHVTLTEGSGTLSLYAELDGHPASMGIEKQKQADRLHGPAGFLYTDRGVYRAGETVHWKAILRSRSTKGELFFKEGRPFDVNISAPGGVSLFAELLELGPFGTLYGDLELPASAPEGQYTVRVQDGDRVQTGTFEVRRFSVPQSRLQVVADRSILLPGQSQTLRIEATYNHGAPIAGANITGWVMAQESLRFDLVTDDEGRAALTLESADLGEVTSVSYQFDLAGEAQAEGLFFLAGRELELGLSTPRELFLADEKFQVDVQAKDVFGSPTARSLELLVIKLETNRQGRSFERTLSKHAAVTDTSGRATVDLSLTEGGRYLLRVEGRDALEQPVSSELALEIAPKDDEQELRFLADTTRFEVGEDVALRLHNNGPGGPALVTVLGRGILEYAVLDLVRGDNYVRFTADIGKAPDAAVRVSRMHAAKLHSAVQRFAVTRELRVEVLTSQSEYTLGESVEVELRVTDAHGRGVETELSLGLVDAAFYELFSERYTNLTSSFALSPGSAPLGEVGSSALFRYATQATEISGALLAERQREEQAKKLAQRVDEAKDWLDKKEGAPSGRAYTRPGDVRPPNAPALAEFEPSEFNDVIGMGGGAGGAFGGRSGGRKSLRAAGGLAAALDPGLDSPTQFWAPAIVTDAEGRATVKIELPDRGGRWRFTARGVDRTSRVGETQAEVTTSADFLVELIAPGALYTGDLVRPSARVFWSGEGAATAYLRFTSQAPGAAAAVQELRVEFEGPGVERVALGTLAAGEERGLLLFDLVATLDRGFDEEDGTGDMARDSRRIDVQPFGIEVEDLAGGFLGDQKRFGLELPSSSATNRRLGVYVGSGLGAELIDAALGGAPFGPLFSKTRSVAPSMSTLDLAGDLLGASAVLGGLEAIGTGSTDQAERLRRRVLGLAGELLLRQDTAGGFGAYPGWYDRSQGMGNASTEVTSQALLALLHARDVVEIPGVKLELAAGFLANRLVGLSTGEEETRAMALHALVVEGRMGSDQLSSLWRARLSLSPAARAHLALAYARLGRSEQAAELAAGLESLVTPASDFGAQLCGIWNQSADQMNALVVWTLARALPSSKALRPAAEALLGNAPWYRGSVRGPALAGLVTWRQEALTSNAGLRARVRLIAPKDSGSQDEQLELLVVAGRPGTTASFEIPDEWPAGSIELDVELISDGRRRDAGWEPTWHARLTGFTADPSSIQTNPSRRASHYLLAAAPVFDHRPLATGYQILAAAKESWENQVTHLARGERAAYRLTSFVGDFGGSNQSGAPRPLEDFYEAYTHVEIPLPAGCVLVPGTVSSTGANWWQTPSGLAADMPGGSWILRFEIMATSEGTFRAPPAVVRVATDPSRLSLSGSSDLTVLAPGESNPDAYRPTPDERNDRGLRLFDAGQFDAAREVLAPLFDEFEGNLRPNARRVLSERLLNLSIRASDSAAIVRFFEDLSAIDPTVYLSLEDIMAIGDAYSGLGEDERASTLYTATLGERFRRDMLVVGVLDKYAGFAASTLLQEDLWHRYPDLVEVTETRLALTDALLTQAPKAFEDAELVRARRDQVSLTLEAILFLREFLVLNADGELAAEAGMNLLQAYTSLEDYPRAAAMAERLAARFDDPKQRDDFRYTQAVALWHTGEEARALELLALIAEAEYPKGRTTVPSENRDLALYLMGQIRHGQGDLVAADALYQRVAGAFPDARELDALFQKKALFVDDVVSVRPGEVSSLTISSKGLEEVELQVYPVDLLALYLREGDLEDVSSINLAGITPVLRATRPLDASLGMRPIETVVELEPFEPGAYLVILRGAELFASGLVVVSDLDLFVEEDPGTGGVRTEVTRGGKALEGVDVRVVGSASKGNFYSGETDRRGLYKVTGVGGQATVIARADQRSYAFHRGAVSLGGGVNADSPFDSDASSDWFLGQPAQQGVDWLKNVSGSNTIQIEGRAQSQFELRNKPSAGVQILSVQ